MQVTYNVDAHVNSDGQVTVSVVIDGQERRPAQGTREQSRAFALEVLAKQGTEGEKAAVEWLRSKGWEVGKPVPREAIILQHLTVNGFPRWAVSLDGPNPETAIPCAGRQEAYDLAAKFNSMGSEKPKQDEKPANKPDLPDLYRRASSKVRALAERSTPSMFYDARAALANCAKADPETAEGLIVYADALTSYDSGELRSVANGLEKCAHLAEAAADVASPRKLAQMVWEAVGNGGNADEWSVDGARAYLRGRLPSTLAKLPTDLADRVKRYVEAS